MNASLVLALALHSVFVDARTTCPDGATIQNRLALLLPGRLGAGGHEPVVTLTGDRANLLVTVLNPDRTVFETRSLAMPLAPCDVAAENVAVVVATMLAEFGPAWVASFSPPAPPARPVALRSLAFEGGPLWASGQSHVGARLGLDGAIARRRSPWSLSATAFFDTGQSFDVEGGQAKVKRGAIVVGVERESWLGLWGLGARLRTGGALLAVSGRGFLKDRTSVSLNPVVGADAVVRTAWHHVGIAVGPGVEYWPRTQGLMVGTSSSTQVLPPFTLTLNITLGYYSRG